MKYFSLTLLFSLFFLISCSEDTVTPTETDSLSLIGKTDTLSTLFTNNELIQTYIVKNSSSKALNVIAKVEVLEKQAEHKVEFCFGDENCQSDITNIANFNNAISVAANSNVTAPLNLKVRPNGKSGNVRVRITFINADKLTDKVEFIQTIQVKGFSLELDKYEETIKGSSLKSELPAYVKVKNVSNEKIDIGCKMIVNQLAPSHEVTFCWGDPMNGGVCYPGQKGDYTAPSKYTLAAGEEMVKNSFIGYVYTFGSMGTSKVTYRFYNLTNENDYVDYKVTYEITF